MPTRNKELSIGANQTAIMPTEDGAIPTFDEIKALMGDGEDGYGLGDAYLNDGQLREDIEAAVKAGTRKRAKRTVNSRLVRERKRLDEQVRQMRETDPRDRDTNPYLTKEHNAMLQRQKAETEANIQALELARESLNLSTTQLIHDEMEGQPLAGRAALLANENLKPEVARLLASLNMNIDLSLNGRQTEQLMSTLLACNEQQIEAILNNNRVPMTVKLMAKRLKDDLKAGSTTSLEMLWDRIFGKGILDINGQAAEYKRSTLAGAAKAKQTVVNIGGRTQVVNGHVLSGEDTNRLLHEAALPDQPLSREAYKLIRERFASEEAEDAVVLDEQPSTPQQEYHNQDPAKRQDTLHTSREYEDLIDGLEDEAYNDEAPSQPHTEDDNAKILEELL